MWRTPAWPTYTGAQAVAVATGSGAQMPANPAGCPTKKCAPTAPPGSSMAWRGRRPLTTAQVPRQLGLALPLALPLTATLTARPEGKNQWIPSWNCGTDKWWVGPALPDCAAPLVSLKAPIRKFLPNGRSYLIPSFLSSNCPSYTGAYPPPSPVFRLLARQPLSPHPAEAAPHRNAQRSRRHGAKDDPQGVRVGVPEAGRGHPRPCPLLQAARG